LNAIDFAQKQNRLFSTDYSIWNHLLCSKVTVDNITYSRQVLFDSNRFIQCKNKIKRFSDSLIRHFCINLEENINLYGRVIASFDFKKGIVDSKGIFYKNL